MSNKITLDVLKGVTPRKQKSMITQDVVDKINKWNEDPRLLEGYSENVLSYIKVLQDGRFKITDYLNAVRYVSYKMLGFNDIDAYAATFPDRYQKLIDEGLERTEIGAYTNAYKNNKLVAKIFEQTVIPLHVTNNHMGQEALNELMKIGLNGRSEMARVAALSKVLDKTDVPEVKKLQLDIGVEANDAIEELRRAQAKLAEAEYKAITSGSRTVKEVAESIIVEAEVEE